MYADYICYQWSIIPVEFSNLNLYKYSTSQCENINILFRFIANIDYIMDHNIYTFRTATQNLETHI